MAFGVTHGFEREFFELYDVIIHKRHGFFCWNFQDFLVSDSLMRVQNFMTIQSREHWKLVLFSTNGLATWILEYRKMRRWRWRLTQTVPHNRKGAFRRVVRNWNNSHIYRQWRCVFCVWCIVHWWLRRRGYTLLRRAQLSHKLGGITYSTYNIIQLL